MIPNTMRLKDSLWDLFLWSCMFITMVTGVRIRESLVDREAVQGESVQFVCRIIVSPNLPSSAVRMKWKHDNVPLDFTKIDKYKLVDNGQVLKIHNLNRYDNGEYTCIASTGQSKDRSTATLRIRTKPEAPKKVKIMGCSGRQVELMWTAGHNGGSDIKSYLVQFNTSYNPNFWNNYHEEIPGDDKTGMITISPWGEYSFRMIARNDIGYSMPSEPTQHTCEAPPDHPDGNPKNVRTLTHKKKKLIISWMPMPRLYHNGPGLKYRVFWRQKGSTHWHKNVVGNHYSKQLEIDVTDIYGLYEVKVKAFNEIGDSFQPPFIILGHSGEAEPTVIPKDFRLDPTQKIRPHTAHFIWESVDTSEDKIRGKFRGYKLRYWKSSEGRHKWKEVVIIVDVGEGNQLPDVRAAIEDLPAFTALRAQVAVMNGHYTGNPSQTIDFFTPEGRPGPVRKLTLKEIGTNYVVLNWLSPERPNGHLMGYDIGYQPFERDVFGKFTSLTPQITNPSVPGARISGLKPNHEYRFFVWAKTGSGKGESQYVDFKTRASAIPEIPNLVLSTTMTSINATWSAIPETNSELQYMFEYRREGESDWTSTDTTSGRSWKALEGLHPNTKYAVRLVAMNRIGETKYSKNYSIVTDARPGNIFDTSGQAASIHQNGSIASRTMSQSLSLLIHTLLALLTYFCVFH